MSIKELKEFIKKEMSELDLHNHDDLVRYRCYRNILVQLEGEKE